MKTLKDRFKAARKKANLTQEALSKISRIPQQKISRIENGITAMPRDIETLANYLDTTAGYLMFGESLSALNNTLPILDWNTVGKLAQIKNEKQLEELALETIESFKQISNEVFGLKVPDDSMLSMEGMSFPIGATLIVDRSAKPKANDYVIAISATGEASFKQLIIDGEKKYLKPLNQRYPIIPMTKRMKICGVVIAMQHTF